MPPEDSKQPEPRAKADFLEALSHTLVAARRTLGDSGGKIVVRRLNRREYQNTIRDLLGVEMDVSDLPPDTGNGTFDTVGSSLFMSSDQVEQYLALGRRALEDVFAQHAAQGRHFKLHEETEKAANVQTRSAMDVITKKSEPARQWHAAVDSAAAKPENAKLVSELRATKEVQEDARRFYRRWQDIQGAPSPSKFGFKDAPEAEMAQGEYDATHKYQERYLTLPKVKEGSYLFIFRLRPEEGIKPPKDMPPGRYTMRFRIAALDDTPPERRFIELGRPSQPGSYDILSTHHITGTLANPQIVEAPVTLNSTDRREFAIREKRLNSREHEVALWVLHERKHKDWLPPSMWIDWIELEGPLPNEAGHGLFNDKPVRELITDFTTRAFRGTKPDAAFVDGLVQVYEKRRARGDSHEQALKAAGSSIDVFVEIDVGQGRCGVADAPAVLRLLNALAPHPQLRFGGLQAYQGGVQHVRSHADRRAAAARAAERTGAVVAALAAAGVACPVVTGGGSGSVEFDLASGVYTELQPGSYVFMDRDYADNQAAAQAPRFEHALFVKSQVMSAGTSHAVVDAGHKSHAIDSGLPRVRGLDQRAHRRRLVPCIRRLSRAAAALL